MTGMDVGELYASVRIDTGNVAGDLKKVKDGLDGVKDAAEAVEKKKLRLDADDKQVKDAKKSTEDLGTAADNAASKSSKIKFPTQYTRDAEQAKSAIDGAVDSIGKMATNAVKWGGLTAATTAIAGIGTALTKGWGRLDALDQAKAKLEALGNSGATVEQVMDNALASVKGTAFGIGEAAGTAAVLVGAGVKPGEELERTLKLVADSAAIAGISFEEMGSIWGKVASNTVLSGEEMAQISDRSIGLQVALAEKFGVTAQEAKKMVSEGKVSFEDFSDAMEGLVGGGAVRMGETVSGAIDNLGAAFGRAGAQVLESGFEAAPGILADLTTAVDGMGEQLAPVAAEWGQKLTPVVADFAANVGPNAAAVFGMIGDAVGVTAPLIGKIADGLGAIPFPVAAAGFATLISQHKGWTGNLADGATKLGGFSKEIGGSLVGAFAKATSATKDSDSALGGLAKGGLSLAKSGMGGLKDAAGGLVTALGGPWGIAIGGASIALGYLAEQHFEAKRAEAEHKAAQDELRGTLDQTTGAITAQTRELQLKRAEESGWLETATQLGISQSTLIDAMNGNERAQQLVNAAVSEGTTAAIEASSAWEKYGSNFQNAGIDAETLAAALDGNAEAQQKVTKAASEYATAFGPGLQSQLNSIRAEVDDTTDAFTDLGAGVGQSATDLNNLQTDLAERNLLSLRDKADVTKGALELLGNTDLKLTKTGIKIPFDQVSEDTLTKLEEIHGITNTTIDGEVTLEFPDGADVLAILETLGIELDSLDGGYIDINTDDPEAAKLLLEEIGVLTKFEDGQLRIDTNAPGVIDILVELGILVADPMTGEVTIDDTSIMTSDERMRTLADAVKAGAKGKVEMEDNAKEVSRNIDRELQGKRTRGYHEIWEQYYTSGRHASTSGTSVGQHYPRNATGGRLPTTGPGTDRTDGILGLGTDGVPTTWVDAGEWIINRRRSDKFDATLNAINSGDEDQILYAALNDLQRLETGGRVDIKSQLAHMNGTPYIFGGWSPAGVDCSGAVSLVANAATGRDPWDGRTSTHTMGPFLAERGFVAGKGGPGTITVGWKNGGPGGGHTAVTLADGTNIESGGNTGGGFTIGGRAASGHDSQFTDFMHLPLGDQAGWTGGGGAAGGGAAGGFSGGGSWTSGGQASTYMRTFQPMEIKEGGSGVGSTLGMTTNPAPEITGDFTRMMNAEIDDAIRRNGLDDLAAQHGMTASLEQAAGAVKDALSDAKIWLSVSPETIEAFNTLGEAQEDRKEAAFNVAQAEKELERARLDAGHSAEDYADQVAAAEKRLAEARESGADKIAEAEKNLDKARKDGKPEAVEKAQKALNKAMSDAPDKIADAEKSLEKLLRDGPTKASDSADRVAEAEQRLEQARLAEERSIAKLEQAQLAYNHALQMAPIRAVQGLLTQVADGFTRLGEVLDVLAQQQERLHALTVARVDAELGLVRSQISLQQAQAAHAQAQRAMTNGQWQDALALQQAEWALSTARAGSGATTYEMAMLEAAVADQKAQNDLAAFERSYALAEAAADLEYAEYIATAQAAQLTIAIDAASKAQAGLYGIHTAGMDALSSVVKGIGQVVAGVVKFVGGLVGLAAAAAQFAAGPGGWPTAIATAAAALPAIGSGVNDMVTGVTTIRANKDEAREQWDNLDLGGKVGVGLAVGGAALSGLAGGAAALGGGSIDDANNIVTGIQDISNVVINAITADREARIDAAEREAKRRQDELDLENKKRELQHLQGQLDRMKDAGPERERLQALADAAAKALAEAQQKHQQNLPTTPAPEMSGPPGTVFFQVGGAGWESMSTTNRVLAGDGGFAGITPDTLGAFESSWDAGGGGVSSTGVIPKMPEVLAKGADAQATTAEATQGMWAELAYVSRVIERIEKQMGAGGQRVGAVFNGPVTMPNAQGFVEDQLSAQVRQSLAR